MSIPASMNIQYISVPIGYERVEYNIHRIFYPKTIIDIFKDLELIEFSITDGCIKKNVDVHKYDEERNKANRFGLLYFKK